MTGGGRRNPAIMRALAASPLPVEPVEAVGLDGDMLEAQAFAFLAVRSLHGLPLTFPGTTGIAAALTGGRLSRPSGGLDTGATEARQRTGPLPASARAGSRPAASEAP